MDGLYTVGIENEEVVVRFRRDKVEPDTIARFLDYLELESIRRQSRLTGEEAEALADEVGREGWARLKSKFLPS